MPYSRPGIYVNEVLQREQTPTNSTTAVGVFIGRARRGPIIPTRFTGWTQVTKAFGHFTGIPEDDVLLQAAYDYLGNGGSVLYACRPVGSGADAAGLDFALVGGEDGAPGATALRLVAYSPGAWGNELQVEVLPGSSEGRFSLVLRIVPPGAAITNQQIVERWSDLSLNPRDARYAIGILNNGDTGSAWVNADLPTDYTYTDGDTLAASTTPGGAALTGGDDGAEVTEADVLESVYALDDIAQPFVLNVPGYTAASFVTALADYADSSRTRQDSGESGRGDVFVVVDTPEGVDAETAISLVRTYPTSDHLAVYYPHLVVADPSNLVTGSVKLVPPGPLVVGRYIATDSARGVFKAPAGAVDGRLAGVLSVDPAASLRNPVLDRLNAANVNAIKLLPGIGVAVYGARTQKRDYITRYVNARRTLIAVRSDLLAAMVGVPFENNDATLWEFLETTADRYLRELHQAGGLKGETAEQAYYVKCDEDTNTLATIQAGEVHMEVGLALQRPAEFVVLTLAQYDGGASVVESINA